MTRYFKVESRKITFKEYWNLYETKVGVFVAWIRKIFGNPARTAVVIPEPHSLAERIVDPKELPQRVFEKLVTGVNECAALGFHEPCYYCIKDRLKPDDNGGVYLLHSTGETMAIIVYVKYRKKDRLSIGLVSLLDDGRVMGTSDKKKEFNRPPHVEVESMPGCSIEQLWKRHTKRLEKIRSRCQPRRFSVPEAYEVLFKQTVRKAFEFNVKRGLWVEMSASEIEAALRRTPPPLPKP